MAVAAIFNTKAKAWKTGRRDWQRQLQQTIPKQKGLIWMHCASAGEFEQGKPVIEALKAQHPQCKIVVSFFSPSGYGVGKKFVAADYTIYLPLDTAQNAARLLDHLQPSLVIFVKYDYWHHHLKAAAERKIPLLLISAIFREKQIFFKWYGSLHRRMLGFFTQLFVQDEASQQLLKKIGIHHSTVAGDTRFDRVVAIAEKFIELDIIKQFASESAVMVAGSTWSDDEKLLAYVHEKNKELKLIIAPHEINKEHITQLLRLFPQADTYSTLQNQEASSNVLIIDNIGMLSRLYRYATITYIGGGFNKSGIHNTLEAAVWHKPVLFGPHYEKFREARELIAHQAAFTINTPEELWKEVDHLVNNEKSLAAAGKAAGDYVANNKGATQMIINYIQEKRLLTTW